jgi:hypothetical protein
MRGLRRFDEARTADPEALRNGANIDNTIIYVNALPTTPMQL